MNDKRNPYAPPVAVVRDSELEQLAPCPHVEKAIGLTWLSFGLGVLGNLVDMSSVRSLGDAIAGAVGIVISAAIGYLIVAWIARKLRAGRNWMRLLLTIVQIVGYLSIVLFWDFYGKVFRTYGTVQLLFLVTQSLIAIAMIVFLNSRLSRDWFAAHKQAAGL